MPHTWLHATRPKGIQGPYNRGLVLKAQAQGREDSIEVFIDTENGDGKTWPLDSHQEFKVMLQVMKCNCLLDVDADKVILRWERLKDGGRYKPYHGVVKERPTKTVQVLGITAETKEYEVENQEAFKQMLQALDVRKLISVDGENVISFLGLRDGQSYHLPPENRRGLPKPDSIEVFIDTENGDGKTWPLDSHQEFTVMLQGKIAVSIHTENGTGKTWELYSRQGFKAMLKELKCNCLLNIYTETVAVDPESLVDGGKYKPYHALVKERPTKTVQILGITAEPKEYEVENQEEFKQMLQALDVRELISVDGENVISFWGLHDGQSYHLPPENRRGWPVAQLQRRGHNSVSAKGRGMVRHMLEDAQLKYPNAEIQEVEKHLFHNAAGDTLFEVDAALIVHPPKGGKHLILGEHKSTLTTENAREVLTKQRKILKMLKEPKEKAREVHDAFASLSQDEVLMATIVVAGDQIVPLEDETFVSAKNELLSIHDVVLTYSGKKFEPVL